MQFITISDDEEEEMEIGGGGRRGSRGMLPILAIQAVSQYYGLDRKPPVTAALVAANTLLYLRPAFLHSLVPTIDEVLFNPHLILKNMDLKRFLLSPFYHLGESHLVYNMMSLLWKGIQLETSVGSAEFASMIATLLGMSQGITLLLAKSLLLFGYERAYYSEYAAGFSGILFAMKVVLNSQSESYTSVYGLIVPARHAAWAELILIQMLVPGVSFIGHLGGILAGILYIRLKASNSGSNPLALIIKGLSSVINWPLRRLQDLFTLQWWRRRRQISGRGTVGRSRDRMTSSPSVWRCGACTFDNSGLASICEMCGTSRGVSEQQTLVQRLHESPDLSLEELRRRRVERFVR